MYHLVIVQLYPKILGGVIDRCSILVSTDIGIEKLFMQCGIDDVFKKVEKLKDKEKEAKYFKILLSLDPL